MGPRRTRVAVVQVAYHPAILVGRRPLRDNPLFTVAGGDSLEAPGKELPDEFTPRLNALRGRIRGAYDAQLLPRVKAILEACRGWAVEVVVFPEYSIPWEILGEVADAGGDLVVVAGTHTVEREPKKKEGLYQRLGLPAEAMPALGQSVAPVLHKGRLLALSAKLEPSQQEPSMTRGTRWTPVEMPGDMPGPMGVMVCLDFLYRESETHRALVGEGLERCRFLAVPSLTPAHSLPEFGGKAWEEARRYGRPVLYCDGSKASGGGGGSSIYVDEGHPTDLKRFPDHAGWLDADDEGVIVADVDLGYERAGKSTRYAQSRPVIPVAAATLVYRSVPDGDAYASWLQAAAGLLERDDDDAVEELSAHVAAGREVLKRAAKMPGGGARGRRLSQLVNDIDRVTSVEQIRQLTREVVLPSGILSLAGVRAGLARGAAEEMRRWLAEPGGGSFGTVMEGLLDGAAEHERRGGPWTTDGQRAIETVVARVRGGAKPAELKAVMAYVDIVEDDLLEPALSEENRRAQDLLDGGRYGEARDAFLGTLERLTKAVEGGEAIARPRLRVWAERCKLGAAVASIQLQEPDRATEQLATIDAALLPPRSRLSLAEARTLVGDLRGAEEILRDLGLPDEAAVLRQRIALRQGEIPDPLAENALVQAEAAAVWLARNDLARAASVALEALPRADKRMVAAGALMALTTALGRTIFETPPNALLVPAGRREEVVNALEKGYDDLREVDLPPPVRRDVDRCEAWFRHLSRDEEDRLAERFVDRGEDGMGEEDDASRRHAYQLAVEGRADDALRALPNDPTAHPWHRRFDRVQLLALGRQFDRALDEAIQLAVDFPDRAAIEHLTSLLCAQVGRPLDALWHAEAAHRQMPGKGLRVWLAEQYMANDRPEDAWKLIDGLTNERPLLLFTRANAALRTGRLEEAERAWSRYVALRPEDARARVQYAQILFRLHRPEKAADVAWRVYSEHGDRLDQEALYACGTLQRLAGDLDVDHRQRIETIAARLKDRFPDTAGPLRVQLLLTLGGPLEGVDQSDFDQLVAQGRATIGHGMSELQEALERHRTLQNAVAHLQQLGAIPLSTATALLGEPLARVIVRILERHDAGFVCPPISLTDVPPAVDLTRATIVVSELELLLLDVLDLIPALQGALGPTGRVVVFERTRSRIEGDFAKLRSSADRRKLAETENLLRQIERLPALEPDPARPYDDAATALKHGAAIIADKAPEGLQVVAPRAFLRYLRARGCIDARQHANVEPYLPQEETPADVEELPARVVVPGYLVEKLFESDALFAVFRAHPGKLFVGPSARGHAMGARYDLADTIRAEQLASRLHDMLNQGWIRVEPDPTSPDLPPLRDPGQTWDAELVLEPLREMVSLHEVLLRNASWLRLTAELYGSVSLVPPDLVTRLAWPSAEAYLTLLHRMQQAAARIFTLPALVRLLILDPEAAYGKLRRLAELGFPDALGAEEVLRLERQYNGLDGIEPTRILDNAEWMARLPQHEGGEYARLRLSGIYSQAMFDAFCAKDGSPAGNRTDGEKAALAYTLLSRQETIGAAAVTNSLDQLLGMLAARTIEHRPAAWKRQGEAYVPDRGGASATLWKTVAGWAGQDRARRAAHGRALRDVWLALDQRPDGPAIVDSITLQSMSTSEYQSGGVSFMAPEMETLAILSSQWKESPLRSQVTDELTYEDVFKQYASAVADVVDTEGDARVLQFAHPSDDGENDLRIFVPMEAIFLRGSSEQRSTMARRIKILQGIHDGELYRLADDIERAPEDSGHLHSYARRAATALFRTVRDDPPFLRTWAQARSMTAEGSRAGIGELLRVLSEPAELPPGAFHDVLRHRLENIWSPAVREDAGNLLGVASEIPGLLAAVPLPWWLKEEDYEDRVGTALDRIARPNDFPIARIAGDIMFLRVAASQRPVVALTAGTVDLRDTLPALLVGVLANVRDKQPKSDTYAVTEAPLLRVCGEVVQRLAFLVALPLREGLWITWRLFQWLCLQLDAISPDARRDGIRRLIAHEPGAQVRRDVLDPFGFGREPGRFDHRLGAVLHALATMEELTAVFRQQQPDGQAPEPRSVSSAGIEDELLDLAHRVHTEPAVPSVLDWGAPDNVPDLALHALLQLNAERFVDLTPEARSRRFAALPSDPSALEGQDRAAFAFATKVLLAAASVASKLTPEERTLLVAKLQSMVDCSAGRFWRWVTFVGLFEAGEEQLKEEAVSLTVEHVKHYMAPMLTGWLLLGIAKRDLSQVEPTLNAMLAAAETSGADAVGIATGLGRLLVHGTPEAKRVAGDLFLRLAERPSLGEDPRMIEVIGLFHLREPQG